MEVHRGNVRVRRQWKPCELPVYVQRGHAARRSSRRLSRRPYHSPAPITASAAAPTPAQTFHVAGSRLTIDVDADGTTAPPPLGVGGHAAPGSYPVGVDELPPPGVGTLPGNIGV